MKSNWNTGEGAINSLEIVTSESSLKHDQTLTNLWCEH